MSFLVVFPLVEGRTLGWPVWLVGVAAAAIPLLVVVGLIAVAFAVGFLLPRKAREMGH